MHEAFSCRTPSRCAGPSATITVTSPGNASVVLAPDPAAAVASASAAAQAAVDATEFGDYETRAEVAGIPVKAFDCVRSAAFDSAAAVLRGMLATAPTELVTRLKAKKVEVVIVGNIQQPGDIPGLVPSSKSKFGVPLPAGVVVSQALLCGECCTHGN